MKERLAGALLISNHDVEQSQRLRVPSVQGANYILYLSCRSPDLKYVRLAFLQNINRHSFRLSSIPNP